MDPDGMLEPVSLVELSVQRLRRDILSGHLASGERLIEEQLTQRFGISRAPLREALRELAQQGLVEHLPRRGVRVADLSSADVDELFGLRDLLERYAVTLALPLPDSQGLARLAGALEAMGTAAQDRDVLREHEAHCQFHIEVVALAGQRHLLQAFEPVILKLELCMAANLRLEAEQRDASQGVARHRKLLDAIASGDLDQVLIALASHGARTYIG